LFLFICFIKHIFRISSGICFQLGICYGPLPTFPIFQVHDQPLHSSSPLLVVQSLTKLFPLYYTTTYTLILPQALYHYGFSRGLTPLVMYSLVWSSLPVAHDSDALSRFIQDILLICFYQIASLRVCSHVHSNLIPQLFSNLKLEFELHCSSLRLGVGFAFNHVFHYVIFMAMHNPLASLLFLFVS
jgi:hypothetical protein